MTVTSVPTTVWTCFVHLSPQDDRAPFWEQMLETTNSKLETIVVRSQKAAPKHFAHEMIKKGKENFLICIFIYFIEEWRTIKGEICSSRQSTERIWDLASHYNQPDTLLWALLLHWWVKEGIGFDVKSQIRSKKDSAWDALPGETVM